MNSKIPFFQIDAFTDLTFKGNPAAVCILSKNYPDEILQKIAAEMNLSETAFLYVSNKIEIENQDNFQLRWFTPQIEVNLCGHATLATAAVLFFYYGIKNKKITFSTKSGNLEARKDQDSIVLDFPINKPNNIQPPAELLAALGLEVSMNAAYSENLNDILIEVENSDIVKNLSPDFDKLVDLSSDFSIRGVIITSKGFKNFDFVSRFFAPWVGIDEDPVTGSAHTILTPYWADRLGRNEMKAYQLSKRGGELLVKITEENRVEIVGKAKIIVEGLLHL